MYIMLRSTILKIKHLILLTNTTLNAKIIPNITDLGTTTTALTAVENKIPNVSILLKKKKTDCYINIYEIKNKINTDHDHDKYIAALEFNKLTSENFIATLK